MSMYYTLETHPLNCAFFNNLQENSSLEDQCKCEKVTGFQNQANEPMRKLPQRHIL
ncbi:UNVERIFIED_CONTAM: hypothetical protein FKN15_003779 [Acipenser sinensis]